jgi:hypothetical protein
LISHETLPSDAELDAYYARQYRSDYHGEFHPSPHRVLRAWSVGRSILQRLRPFLREGDRVLEIGAGIGCTVKAFDVAGFDAEGIEPHLGFSGVRPNASEKRGCGARRWPSCRGARNSMSCCWFT